MDKSVFAVWKPKGPTSFRIVSEIRKITGVKKVGHAGTLDPLAEGILVIGLGREGTRQLKAAVAEEKEYEATVMLGEESVTDDAEGSKIKAEEATPPTREMIEVVIQKFIGEIEQTPPPYSALKIKGKPAYKLARAGKTVTLQPRLITIKNIEVLEYAWPTVRLRVTTGPGVYIRSLARDLGRELKTGGYLAGLVRTRVGPFTKELSIELDKLADYFGKK